VYYSTCVVADKSAFKKREKMLWAILYDVVFAVLALYETHSHRICSSLLKKSFAIA
jgi:hypothetical protein